MLAAAARSSYVRAPHAQILARVAARSRRQAPLCLPRSAYAAPSELVFVCPLNRRTQLGRASPKLLMMLPCAVVHSPQVERSLLEHSFLLLR